MSWRKRSGSDGPIAVGFDVGQYVSWAEESLGISDVGLVPLEPSAHSFILGDLSKSSSSDDGKGLLDVYFFRTYIFKG